MIKIFDGKKESAYLMRKTADINILGKCAGAGAGGTATGSTTFGTTVTHYDLGAASVAGEPAFSDYGSAYHLIVEGDFDYTTLTGTKYIENCYNEIEVGDGGYYHKYYTQEERTINRSDWYIVDDGTEKYVGSHNVYVLHEGDQIMLYESNEDTVYTVETPGIYFKKTNSGEEHYLIEMDLAVSTVIDERCLPISAITKTDLSHYQASWYVNDHDSPCYIVGRPFYSTKQSYEWGDWTFLNEENPVTIDIPGGHKMYLIDRSFVNDYDWVNMSVYAQDGDETRIISVDYAAVYEDGMAVVGDNDAVFIEEGYDLSLIIYVPQDNYDASDTLGDEWPVFPSKGLYARYISETKFATGIECGRVEKLDEQYIPELTQVILKSSTPYSWKKFKVTVNDEGQLTAEEIPEE